VSELITLSQSSPKFESYLLGNFAKNKRALPLQTLNVNSAAETVTFKIVDVKDIQKPPLLVRWAMLLKVRSFLFLLVPLFLVLTKNIADETRIDPLMTAVATAGVFLAFIAVNLRNDFIDHMRGVDRVLDRSGSRAIQRGWTTASRVKHLSSFFIILALLCGVPVIVAVPAVGEIVGAAAVIGLWAQFRKRNSFKYRIGGELVLFIMLGPLLTVGYQLAMGAQLDAEVCWLGCLWGWLILFIVQLKNFTHIFVSSQAHFTNTVTWLGFDKSRRMLAMWWGLFILFNLMYHIKFAGFYWGWFITASLAIFSIRFILQLKTISSPVGSELRHVFRSGYGLFLLTIALWCFECLWYLIR